MLKKVLKGAYKLAKNILETSVEVANVKKDLVFGVMDRVGDGISNGVKGIGDILKNNSEILIGIGLCGIRSLIKKNRNR